MVRNNMTSIKGMVIIDELGGDKPRSMVCTPNHERKEWNIVIHYKGEKIPHSIVGFNDIQKLHDLSSREMRERLRSGIFEDLLRLASSEAIHQWMVERREKKEQKKDNVTWFTATEAEIKRLYIEADLPMGGLFGNSPAIDFRVRSIEREIIVDGKYTTHSPEEAIQFAKKIGDE